MVWVSVAAGGVREPPRPGSKSDHLFTLASDHNDAKVNAPTKHHDTL